ncbi:fibrillarin, partial [Trifolium pratense]
ETHLGWFGGIGLRPESVLLLKDGLVYVVGFSNDVAHMAGKRPNVVTILEKYFYTHYRMLLSMVYVVFGEIDDLPNKTNNMNSTGHAIFACDHLEREFKLIQTVMLDLVKGAYALNIGGYRMPDE